MRDDAIARLTAEDFWFIKDRLLHVGEECTCNGCERRLNELRAWLSLRLDAILAASRAEPPGPREDERIIDTSHTDARVDPAELTRALGAEHVGPAPRRGPLHMPSAAVPLPADVADALTNPTRTYAEWLGAYDVAQQLASRAEETPAPPTVGQTGAPLEATWEVDAETHTGRDVETCVYCAARSDQPHEERCVWYRGYQAGQRCAS